MGVAASVQKINNEPLKKENYAFKRDNSIEIENEQKLKEGKQSRNVYVFVWKILKKCK